METEREVRSAVSLMPLAHLAKLLIEKGVFTQDEFMEKFMKTVGIMFLLAILAGCSFGLNKAYNDLVEQHRRHSEQHFAPVHAAYRQQVALLKCTDALLEAYRVLPKAPRADKQRLRAEAKEQNDRCHQKAIAGHPRPVEMRRDEAWQQFAERKTKEWENINCTYQAGLAPRPSLTWQEQVDSCLRDLELKRLREAVEKLR